jgi:glucosamine-6-phosphate deaminase
MAVPLTVFTDDRALGAAVAGEIADGMAEAAKRGEPYVLGCPGGRSPRTTYEALASIVRERQLDLTGVVIAMMDDYVVDGPEGPRPVPSDTHYSVAAWAEQHIVGPLNAAAGPGRGITPDRVWSPDPARPDEYETRLLGAGVDLFILASGDSDGHVAFNPPGTPPDARTRVVDLAESTRRDNLGTFPEFGSIDEVPTLGVSIGVGTIADVTRRAILVAPGESKRLAVQRLAAAEGYDADWPATVVALCRRPAVYTDVAGAPERAADAITDARPGHSPEGEEVQR